MKVLIMDDQASVRSALKCVLEQEEDIQVVGEIDDQRLLVRSVETTHPNLLIVDWELLNQDGDRLFRTIREHFSNLYILAMRSRPTGGKLGLSDKTFTMISKSDSPDKLFKKLRQINQSINESLDRTPLQTQ